MSLWPMKFEKKEGRGGGGVIKTKSIYDNMSNRYKAVMFLSEILARVVLRDIIMFQVDLGLHDIRCRLHGPDRPQYFNQN